MHSEVSKEPENAGIYNMPFPGVTSYANCFRANSCWVANGIAVSFGKVE